ncbi:hypothetical protein BWI17_13440 [Betaproteobacteria bacterium GR16-43]|nr:hypothetical protein BWI17_13440 [Betaproteobacteria bacterium GR16-43]
MKFLARLAAAGAAAALVAACTEPSQDPARSYAGKEDAKAYSGDAFKGDKAKWESALAARSEAQNDYGNYRAAGKKKTP